MMTSCQSFNVMFCMFRGGWKLIFLMIFTKSFTTALPSLCLFLIPWLQSSFSLMIEPRYTKIFNHFNLFIVNIQVVQLFYRHDFVFLLFIWSPALALSVYPTIPINPIQHGHWFKMLDVISQNIWWGPVWRKLVKADPDANWNSHWHWCILSTIYLCT